MKLRSPVSDNAWEAYIRRQSPDTGNDGDSALIAGKLWKPFPRLRPLFSPQDLSRAHTQKACFQSYCTRNILGSLGPFYNKSCLQECLFNMLIVNWEIIIAFSVWFSSFSLFLVVKDFSIHLCSKINFTLLFVSCVFVFWHRGSLCNMVVLELSL